MSASELIKMILLMVSILILLGWLLSNILINAKESSNIPVCRHGYLYDNITSRQIIAENGGGIKCEVTK